MNKLGLNLFKKRFEVRILFGSNLPLKLVRDLPGSSQQDDFLITRERGEFTPLSMYLRIKETLTPDPLIEGELEKMIQVSHGLWNQEIEDRLVVEEVEVRTHVSHILSKLYLANRVQAML